MMWPWRKFDPRDTLIEVLREEVRVLRSMHDKDTQRMDRLMEAMSSRAGFNLVMPPPDPPPPLEKVHVPNPWKDPNQITPIKEKTQ